MDLGQTDTLLEEVTTSKTTGFLGDASRSFPNVSEDVLKRYWIERYPNEIEFEVSEGDINIQVIKGSTIIEWRDSDRNPLAIDPRVRAWLDALGRVYAAAGYITVDKSLGDDAYIQAALNLDIDPEDQYVNCMLVQDDDDDGKKFFTVGGYRITPGGLLNNGEGERGVYSAEVLDPQKLAEDFANMFVAKEVNNEIERDEIYLRDGRYAFPEGVRSHHKYKMLINSLMSGFRGISVPFSEILPGSSRPEVGSAAYKLLKGIYKKPVTEVGRFCILGSMKKEQKEEHFPSYVIPPELALTGAIYSQEGAVEVGMRIVSKANELSGGTDSVIAITQTSPGLITSCLYQMKNLYPGNEFVVIPVMPEAVRENDMGAYFSKPMVIILGISPDIIQQEKDLLDSQA